VLLQIDVHDVGNQDAARTAFAGLRLVLGADVVSEPFFSASNVALAAACADLGVEIADDPGGGASLPLSEVEPRSFGATRHLRCISPSADSVTKCFPATTVGVKFPRLISVRNAAGLTRIFAAPSASVRRGSSGSLMSLSPVPKGLRVSERGASFCGRQRAFRKLALLY
jgi:hypothetical protein